MFSFHLINLFFSINSHKNGYLLKVVNIWYFELIFWLMDVIFSQIPYKNRWLERLSSCCTRPSITSLLSKWRAGRCLGAFWLMLRTPWTWGWTTLPCSIKMEGRCLSNRSTWGGLRLDSLLCPPGSRMRPCSRGSGLRPSPGLPNSRGTSTKRPEIRSSTPNRTGRPLWPPSKPKTTDSIDICSKIFASKQCIVLTWNKE